MSRYNLTEPKVGAGRGSSIKFGTPQAFRLAVSRPVTTVYLPMPTSNLSKGEPTPLKPVNEILQPRLQCFPNEDQYIDNWESQLPSGNYQVRFIPIGEELSDDEESMDTDFNENGVLSPEMQTEFGVKFDNVKTGTMTTPLPQKSSPPAPAPASPPPPPPPPKPFENYPLVHPPSAPPITYSMVLVDEIVLSKLGPDVLVIESPCKPIKKDPTPAEPDPAAKVEKIYQLKRSDLDVFKLEKWLDDTVIEYYMHLIQTRNNAQPDFYPTVYSFFGGFYTLLATSGGLAQVEQTANGENIFNFDLIFFPVCTSHHWILVVADNRTLTVTAYNSFNHTAVKLILNNIIRYLKTEYRRLNGGSDPPQDWDRVTNEDNDKIPQQENAYDCGVFTLQFAEYLSRGEPFDFNQIHMPYFRAKCLYECISGRLITT